MAIAILSQAVNRFLHLLSKLVREEVYHQGRNIFGRFAQWWHSNRKNIQAIVVITSR